MNKAIEKYIPSAVDLIEAKLAKNGKVATEYKGYISSMGASIIQSGLVATLAFYSAKEDNSGAAQAKQPLLDILHDLLKDKYQQLKNIHAHKDILSYALDLQRANNRAALQQLQRNVLNASVAMKLALRTFELVKNEAR